MTKPNFSTMGTFGDTIYSLCLMKYLGGGNLYVKLNALDKFAKEVIGWGGAGAAAGRYTEADYENIEPLLKAQDYFDSVQVWNGEHIDYIQLEDHWKFHVPKGWQGNQTECYALSLGLNIHDPDIKSMLLYEPWLTPVEPIKIPNKQIVVNRTSRYLYGPPSQEWYGWAQTGLSKVAVFVGSEQEHKDFQETFDVKIDYYKTKNLLELAQVIQGAEQFIGNQSAALSIAIGLGKSYYCEIAKNYQSTRTPHGGYGDTWFPRINGFYF